MGVRLRHEQETGPQNLTGPPTPAGVARGQWRMCRRNRPSDGPEPRYGPVGDASPPPGEPTPQRRGRSGDSPPSPWPQVADREDGARSSRSGRCSPRRAPPTGRPGRRCTTNLVDRVAASAPNELRLTDITEHGRSETSSTSARPRTPTPGGSSATRWTRG